VSAEAEVVERKKGSEHNRWVNIKVPRALLAALEQLKKSPKEAWWVVVARLITIASGVQREWDRRFWYQFKVVNGWCYLKTAFELQHRGLVDAAFVSAQRERFLETVREVRARVRGKAVDSAAAALAEKLKNMEKPTGREIAECNDLVKQLCLYILTIQEGE